MRRTQAVRDAVADVSLTPSDLVLPLFVTAESTSVEVPSMPGVRRWSVGDAIKTIGELSGAGLTKFILFGVTPDNKKDTTGGYALQAEAPVNRVLRDTRDAGLEATLFADLCFCEYTSHGHCGVLSTDDPHATVDNDRTLVQLGEAAAVLAASGADVVAPSGMMDGQVGAVRTALDDAGHQGVAVLSYCVKYASSLYGPFRDAGGGGMSFGDRRAYQMDYRRKLEWRVELDADVAQGADMVMVKPAIPYLDILHQVRAATALPVAAYHVSGEYAMLHAAAQRGWLELKPAVLESMHAIKRAGADMILTYFADELLQWL